jgi:hypothetical protein
LSTRIITSCRSLLGSPSSIAGSGIDLDVHVARLGRQPSADAASDATSPGQLHPLERHRPRVRAGEQRQVVDHRGQVRDLGVDVVQRLARLAHRPFRVTGEVLDRRPDHGQRRPQLVARVRGELALAAERGPLGGRESRIGTSARSA